MKLSSATMITRSKIYHRRGRYAWTWVYTVHAPDPIGTPAMVGDCLGWAKDAARRAIADGRASGPVVVSWTPAGRAALADLDRR